MIAAGAPSGLPRLIDACATHGCVHFVTDGSWSLYDLLLHVAGEHTIRWLCITTYSMTELSARVIGQLVQQGKIQQVYFLMDYKAEMRYPNVYQILRNIGQVASTHLHAKVMVMEYAADQDDAPVQHLTLLGSANWTRNPRIEVGVLDASPAVATQHREWILQKFTHDTD